MAIISKGVAVDSVTSVIDSVSGDHPTRVKVRFRRVSLSPKQPKETLNKAR